MDGSLALNIVNNDTQALVGLTPGEAGTSTASITITGTGNVSVSAASAQTNYALATPSAGDAGGSSVGVGASIAINVVGATQNVVNAEIADGTSFSGTIGGLTVSAAGDDGAYTHAENGASGSVAIGVGAAVPVIDDTTTAYVGSGNAIKGTGDVNITAAQTTDFTTETDAKAAGGKVGVGASISVTVVTENVSADVARGIATSGGLFNLTSNSMVSDDAMAVATVKGEDSSGSSGGGGNSSADGQASEQESGATMAGAKSSKLPSAGAQANSSESTSSSAGGDTSSGGSSGKGGGDSSGVGVAAAVSVNVLTANNTAEVSNGADVSASGAVTIAAEAGDSASAEAIGASVAMDNNVNIGAGVALNVVNGSNKAFVDAGGSAVQGDGITIEAVTPSGQSDNFIAWGAAAAGGKGELSIAGSVGINVVTFNTEASARSGSYLNSSGGINVTAIANLDPQTLGAAGAFSQGGNAIGATVTVGVLNASTTAFIGGNADAASAISVDAENHLAPSPIAIPFLPAGADPSATSVAVAGAASSGDVAIGGSFIVNVFTLDVDAHIGGGSDINQGVSGISGVTGALYTQTTSQTITISAVNDTQITAIAGALGLTTGDAGVGIGLDVEILNKTTLAYISGGATVSAGGAIGVTAESKEQMLSIAATAGVADEVGVAASISVAVISPVTEAYIGSPASAVGATVNAGGGVTVGAADTFSTSMIAGSVGAAGSAGIGLANTTLVLSPTTEAFVVGGSHITAAGTVSISAQASENLITIAAGIAVGGEAGVAGSAAVNVLSDTTTAYVGPSAHISTTTTNLNNNPSNLVVSASDDTTVVSVAGSLAASGSVGVGVGADVGTYTKHTNAYIDSGVIADIAGNIEVTAESSESLISVSAGIAVGGDAGVGVNAGVHIFNLQTRAFIGDDPLNPSGAGAGNVHAQGSIYLNANDMSDINEIVGVIAASGVAGVGAAVGVNVFNPDTESFIGAGADVTGEGNGSGLLVDTGGISIGFTPAAPSLDPSNPGGVGIETNDPSTMTMAENGDQSGLEGQGQVGTPKLAQMNLGSGSTSVQDPSLSGVRTASLGTENGFHGVAVTASNRDQVRTFTISLAGGTVGVAVSAGADVDNATTKAYIGDSATVNANTSGANPAQSVLVGAGDDFYHLAVAGSVAGGVVGVGPAVGVNIITNTTEAYIGQSATVNALGDIAVAASGSENIVMIGFGIAAGVVGVGGAVDVLSITNTTIASIGDITFVDGNLVSVGDGDHVSAGGNVFVDATDDTHVFLLSGALAGGLVGVGGSVGVMIIDKNTDATIGTSATVDALGNTSDETGLFDGSIDASGTFTAPDGDTISGGNFGTTSAGGVIVQAESSEDILHIVAAGAGGFVGVSGAVGVTLINSNTDAEIGADAQIDTLYQGLAGPNQSVYVNAANDTNVQTFVVGVAVGAGAISGAVDVGTLNNNTSAKVDAGASVNARDNVEVNAVGIKNITGVDVSGAAGAVGVGGAVSVWAIGTQIQKSTEEENGQGQQTQSGSALSDGSQSADSSAGSQAQSGATTVTGGNGLGTFTGDSTGNGNTSQNRIQSATGQAETTVNNMAPTASSVSSAENAASTPAGTTAQMDGTATAGGNIGVTANDQAHVTVTAGQVSVGIFGAGASVAILSVNDNVSALADGTLKRRRRHRRQRDAQRDCHLDGDRRLGGLRGYRRRRGGGDRR